LNNPLLTPKEVNISGANDVPVMFAPGDSTQVQSSGDSSATTGDGLGSGSSGIWRSGAHLFCFGGLVAAFVL
jgi:hypothetical protein